jgi:ATP-dependent protease ClpP protease subunit
MKSAIRQRARQSYALVGSAGGPATLYIYGEIGEAGVTAARVAADIEALGPVEKLTVRVSSYGGDAMEGVAINSLLRSLPYDVEVVIDGIAASAASVIAVAGRRVLMPRTALMMLHDPWAVALGDAEDMRRQADMLDKVKSALTAAYLTKAPEIDRDRLDTLLAEETWLTAEEAVELGLADEIVELDGDRKAPANSAFGDNLYAAIARRLAASAAAVRAQNGGNDISKEMAMAKRRKPVSNKAETPIEEEESARAVEAREDEETSAEGDPPEGKTETEVVAPAPEEDDNDEAGNADASAGGDDEEDDVASAKKAQEDEEADDALALAVRLRAAGESDAIALARAWAGLTPSEIAAKIELRLSIRAAIATARQLGTISSTVETAALNAGSLGEARAILFDAIASAQEATAIDRRPQPAGDVGLAGAIDAYEIARARFRAGLNTRAAKETR